MNKNKVELYWLTATEVNNYGFEIQRKSNLRGHGVVNSNSDLEGYTKIGFIKGNGNSNSPKAYSFADKNITAGTYNYRLKQIDNDGKFEYSQTIEVSLSTPTEYILEQNYPNPFNPNTSIKYSIAKAGFVTLKIYNTLGEEAATLVNEEKLAGNYKLDFNALDLSSGIYIYQMRTNNFTSSKKMLLLK